MLERARATPIFLRHLAEQALMARPPLGIFGGFETEGAAGGPRTLDLKKSGAWIFVDCARVAALATGVSHTGTAERLRQAGARLGIAGQETDGWIEAFFFIHLLRLRHQTAYVPPADANRIDPDTLNEVDRRTLKEASRQAGKLQSRIALDYQL